MRQGISGIIKALGLVFGDIGTSPIYTVTVIFLLLKPDPNNIIGVISLVIWTLVVLVFLQYDFLAMSLSVRGEGGTIVLREIFTSLMKPGKKTAIVTVLSFVGVSLLMGDGVITPAISILSAVEGAVLIPGLQNLSKTIIVVIAAVIAVFLFLFQKKGTEKVAVSFGPIMGVWFVSLTLFGVVSLTERPEVITALNPYYGLKFLIENGWKGYIVLGEVILCATGGRPSMQIWDISVQNRSATHGSQCSLPSS
jgi:KUP system potassium uptake protein